MSKEDSSIFANRGIQIAILTILIFFIASFIIEQSLTGNIARIKKPGTITEVINIGRTPQCNDNKDNDQDSLKDYPEDYGCTSLSDTSESDTLTSNLIAYYNFDNNLLDISNNGNNGIPNGNPQYNPLDKKKGTHSLQLDGIDDYIRLTTNNLLPVYNQNSFTISMWVKSSSTIQSDKRIFSEGEGTSGGVDPLFTLGTGTSNNAKLKLFLRNDANIVLKAVESASTVFDNNWHNVVFLDNNGNVQVYIDGVLDPTSFSYTPSGTFTLDRDAIGAQLKSSASQYFNGLIDEVRVYNRILNTIEIGLLANALTTGGTGICGDTSVQCPNSQNVCEICDPPGSTISCTTSNNYPGTQSCNSQCTSYNTCTTTLYCGDGSIDGPEQCDDANTNNGDGCSSTCIIEAGWTCSGEPSICNQDCDVDNDGFNGIQCSGNDCNDNDASVYPGAPEICDNKDNQCPGDTGYGQIDEGGICGSAPTLIPGSGWTGPTQQPPNVGNPGDPGYNAKSIARWDDVPFQAFNGKIQVGVVAFHINNIDRVEFSVDNGPWTIVNQMTLNPKTNVYDYVAELDSSLFSGDKPVEVRAKVIPKTAGIPRMLQGTINYANNNNGEHSLYLYADKSNSFANKIRWADSVNGVDVNGCGTTSANSCRTIYKASMELQNSFGNADGGKVYLMPGNYDYAGKTSSGDPVANNAWLTIQAAPGYTQQQVKIVSSSSSTNLDATKLVHIKDVFISTKIKGESSYTKYIWLDNTEMTNNDFTTSVSWSHPSEWLGGMFMTDAYIHDTRDGAVNYHLVRNTRIESMGEDAMKADVFVMNVIADDITPKYPGAHGDVWQHFWSYAENIILYGLHATNADAQGIFVQPSNSYNPSDRIDNTAIVNVFIEHLTAAGRKSEWNVDSNHLVMEGLTLVKDSGGSGSLIFQPTSQNNGSYGTQEITNLMLRNNILECLSYKASSPPLSDTTWASNNHYINPSCALAGTQYTTGPVAFVNINADDYHPDCLANPVVCSRAVPNVPVDALNALRGNPTAIGALKGSNE